jgi:hypothetical protein
MPLLGVIIHPFQLPARWNLTRTNNFTYKQQLARLSILILSKTYPTKVTSRHVGLLAGGLFCQKATRIMDPYFQYFSSDSSEITITMMSN